MKTNTDTTPKDSADSNEVNGRVQRLVMREAYWNLLADPKPMRETFFIMAQYSDWREQLKRWRLFRIKNQKEQLMYKFNHEQWVLDISA